MQPLSDVPCADGVSAGVSVDSCENLSVRVDTCGYIITITAVWE